MVNVCLIGCGGVGKRHLEAMLKVKNDINIEVVEPNIENTPTTLVGQNINYFSKIEDVSNNIDICLIATTANVRKKVILELVSKKNVKFMILEKVVFQNEKDFDEIIKLFEEKNIKSWVNCHLRAQPIYKELKTQSIISYDTTMTYEYSDDFTLSSSAIHILDLFSYLCDDYDLEIQDIVTDTELKSSRHSGCVDFNGYMKVKSTNGYELVVKKRDAHFGEHLTIYHNDLTVRSSEGDDPDNRIGFVQDKKIPYVWQSSLTNSYIDDIIEKSDCDLSTLENSAKLHKIMLKSFRNLLKEKYNREVVDCPIT
jgi:hypothetical protein|tara:strand:+ start:7469 stop:8401 length:933 start_codon:yes stop_codon:yes gene_type:complete